MNRSKGASGNSGLNVVNVSVIDSNSGSAQFSEQANRQANGSAQSFDHLQVQMKEQS